MPDEENPVPVTVRLEKETVLFPEFVTVAVCVVLVPVVMLPKLSEVGEAESCKTGVTLVPLRETTNGELGELFTSERFA